MKLLKYLIGIMLFTGQGHSLVAVSEAAVLPTYEESARGIAELFRHPEFQEAVAPLGGIEFIKVQGSLGPFLITTRSIERRCQVTAVFYECCKVQDRDDGTPCGHILRMGPPSCEAQ